MKLRELRRKIPGKKLRPIVSKSLSKAKAPKRNQKLYKTPPLAIVNKFNIKNNNLSNLFSHPTPPIVPSSLTNNFANPKALKLD